MSVAEGTANAITRSLRGERLSREETVEAFLPILCGDFPGADTAWGALFAAMYARSPTVEELTGLIDAIFKYDPDLARQLSSKLDLSELGHVLSITGSGKESFKTFNVSTAAAIVAACHPGVCVVKPAGRATSARTGASDVLEALGVRLPTTLSQVADVARRAGICVFDYHLVAPRYGPRYEGRFHHLHPLSHVTPWLFLPLQIDALLFGIADSRTDVAASAMRAYGLRRAAVASTDLADRGQIDEAATFGTVRITRVVGAGIETSTSVSDVPDDLDAIAQRDSHTASADLVRQTLTGAAPQLAIDLVCANAAVLLHTAGMTVELDEARALCEEYIERGAAFRVLERLVAASQDLTPLHQEVR